jgi:WD40 repeat protein
MVLFAVILSITTVTAQADMRTAIELGNRKAIRTLVYSVDGKALLTHSTDAMQLRDGETMLLIASLYGGRIGADSLAISHDGKRAVSVLYDTTRGSSFEVWNLETGSHVRQILPKDDATPKTRYDSVALSPDGSTLVSGARGVLYLWDTATGEPKGSISSELVTHRSIAFTPSGDHIITGGNANKIWVIDTATLRVDFNVFASTFCPLVAYTSDARIAVGAGSDGISVIDTVHRKEMLFVPERMGRVTSIDVTDDGKLALIVEDGKRCTVRELATGAVKYHFTDESLGYVHTAVFRPNGGEVLLTTELSGLVNWDFSRTAAGATPVGTTLQATWQSNAVFSLDGRFAVSQAGMEKSILVWDLERCRFVQSFTVPWYAEKEYVTRCAISPDGGFVAAGGSGGSLTLWNIATGEMVWNSSTDGFILSMDFTVDGKQLLSASMLPKNSVDVRDVATGTRVQSFGNSLPLGSTASLSPDGSLLALGSNTDIQIWNPRTGAFVMGFTDPRAVKALAMSVDGGMLASGGNAMSVQLWNFGSRTLIASSERFPASTIQLAFTEDCGHLVACDADGTIRVLSAIDGTTFSAHGLHSRITSVATGISDISADGRYVMKSGEDLEVWDAFTGELLLTAARFRDGEWVMIDASGSFTASDGAVTHLTLVSGNSSIRLPAKEWTERRRETLEIPWGR